ncbi:MAG TPA: succinylglutamate desuccinylase/aspartoacylase family protein [bacterium]|nr:succinylglutamate desuccinylase/aspartoacylase family protein [bacterium]
MTVRDSFVPKLEVLPPDISPYRRGNTGIDYVTTLDSGVPGPHVMINALTHGNEICGAHALDYLFRQDVRPRRGKLTLSFANVEAFLSFRPADPFASRYVDEDFNRLWTDEVMGSSRNSRELKRARSFLPLVRELDFQLDIHSMHLPSPPLLMCGMQDKGVALGRGLGYPQHLVRDWGHAAGKRMRDYGAFDDPLSPKAAMLVECGQHWEQQSVTVATETALRFLRHTGVVDADWAAERLRVADPAPPQLLIEVSGPITIKTDQFRFVEEYLGMEVIAEADTVIGYDGDEEIRTPFDNCVLVMPGRQLMPGLSAVRLGRLVNLAAD